MSEKRYSHKDRRPGNTGRRTASDRERLEARRKRKERNIQELKEEAASRVSYVRRPFAKRSLICLALTGILRLTVTEMPSFGSADNPTNNEVAQH